MHWDTNLVLSLVYVSCTVVLLKKYVQNFEDFISVLIGDVKLALSLAFFEERERERERERENF